MPFWESIKEATNNKIIRALAIAGIFTAVAGYFADDGHLGFLQGVSIYIGLFLIVSFTSINDWIKDKNLVKLQSQVQKDKIAVLRGKHGVTQTISIYKLVVGDIVLLEPGCMVPADCVLIEGEDILANESRYSEDRFSERKSIADFNNTNTNQHVDPFLLSSTLIN